MLSVTVKEGGYVKIGDDILVKYVCDVKSGEIRMGIVAPNEYKISRDQVFERELEKKVEAKEIDDSVLEAARAWKGNKKQRMYMKGNKKTVHV